MTEDLNQPKVIERMRELEEEEEVKAGKESFRKAMDPANSAEALMERTILALSLLKPHGEQLREALRLADEREAKLLRLNAEARQGL